MVEKFPEITLSGNSYEIGHQHGTKLKDRIHKTIEFYTDVTKNLTPDERKTNEELILQSAEGFAQTIKSFNKNYADEIEGIAEGSSSNPLWIYALNARSEIMSNMENNSTECTALYFQPSRLHGQNWDWSKDFEDLAVLMRIKPNDGPRILQMTEPGILGKIGFNSSGIGVTLNFLHQSTKLHGVPIHIILRSLLDSEGFDEALQLIKNLPYGQSGNIILSSDDGRYQNVEFAGDKRFFLQNSDPVQVHTNHYLKDPSINLSADLLQSSYARFERANSMQSDLTKYTLDEMKSILADGTNSELPICRPYIEGRTMQDVGSVCSIILDLQKRQMHFTHGHPANNPYVVHNLM